MGTIVKYLKNHFKPILFFIIFSSLNFLFTYLLFSSYNLPIDITFIVISIISFIVEIILFYLLFKSKSSRWPIEKIFLVFSLIVGSFYVLAIPIGRAPDEESHFFRAYELSNGHLVSDINENGDIGTAESSSIEIIRDFKEKNVTYSEIASNIDIYPEEEQSFVVTSAYNYNIFSYLPQVVGIWLGRIFNLSLLRTAYLAKFINLIVCIIILYFSIKYIPIFKKFLFLQAFLPVTMQAMASFSPDGLVIATATALISLVLYFIYSYQHTFQPKHYFLIFIICLFLSMSKIAYAPLCLLLFAIPAQRFGSWQKKICIILGIGASIFAVLVLWLIMAPSMQSVSDSSAQISTILGNPIGYLAIILHSVSANFNLYLLGFFGSYLEWFNIMLSPVYIIPNIVIFIILCHQTSQTLTITKTFKYLAILVSTILAFMTFTTMFIQWTNIGATIIDGVQGRYFIPIMLLIPSFFLRTKKPNSKPLHSKFSHNYYLYGFLLFESVYAITNIICSHL